MNPVWNRVSPPSGNFTTNSLMNEATLWLEITSHSHSLIPNTSLPAQWWSYLPSLLPDNSNVPNRSTVPCDWNVLFSVGRISPPPSTTRHRHWPQVPPTLHKRKREKYSVTATCFNRVPPIGTSSSFSSFTVILRYRRHQLCFGYQNNTTSTKMISRNTMTLAHIVNPPTLNKYTIF